LLGAHGRDMYFLDVEEARLAEKKLLRQIAVSPKPKLILYYDSGGRDYSDAANAIVASAGEFNTALLHVSGLPLGSGWSEHDLKDERWNRYREWRSANGETRPLHEFPRHQFEAGEGALLAEALQFAFLLGWDVLVAAMPGLQLLVLSHDDRMDIYRGFEWRSLSRTLTRLGYWHVPERPWPPGLASAT